MKAPTAREIEMIKELLERAGDERELGRWIRLAAPRRRRGRPAGSSPFFDADDTALLVAEILHLGKGISLHAAIKLVASWGPLRWEKDRGSSQSAMVKRLLAKAHAERVTFEQTSEAELQCIFKNFYKWGAGLDENDPQWLIAHLLGKHLSLPYGRSEQIRTN